MPVTVREAFKRGFLARCADEGLDAAGAEERLTKAAALWPQLLGMGTAVTSGAAPYVAAAALGVPAVGGALIGSTLAKATDDDTSLQEVHNDELIAEYQRLADQARRRAAAKALMQAQPRPKSYRL